jgi:hypothetical protein
MRMLSEIGNTLLLWRFTILTFVRNLIAYRHEGQNRTSNILVPLACFWLLHRKTLTHTGPHCNVAIKTPIKSYLRWRWQLLLWDWERLLCNTKALKLLESLLFFLKKGVPSRSGGETS